MKQLVLIYFLMVANLLAQGTKPPVTTLSGLSDVNVGSPTTGDVLTYDSTSSPPKWKNFPPALGNIANLNGVSIISPADKQVLRYNAGSFSWVNYGPLAFSDITGNIAAGQMNSGSGASATTFWRGDNTWASPTGAIPGSANTVQKSDGLNWVASTETYAAPGTNGNLMTSDGTNWISAAASSSVYINSSLTTQNPAAAEFYMGGSTITLPAGAWKQGGIYHCTFDMLKTAAGSLGIILTVRLGTLGTTGDASVATISYAAGTAVADIGMFDVWITFRSVGSGSSAVIALATRCTHGLAVTGLTSSGASGTGIPLTVVSTGFNSTTATKLGITFTGGTSFSGTNGFVHTEYQQ